MSGDIRNIIKEQKYCDKRILDVIKNYLWHTDFKNNPHLNHIYWTIVEGRKAKEKNEKEKRNSKV